MQKDHQLVIEQNSVVPKYDQDWVIFIYSKNIGTS